MDTEAHNTLDEVEAVEISLSRIGERGDCRWGDEEEMYFRD